MERRSSLGGHMSLSTSNLASPLAESTQINGSSVQSKFPWGGKMSPAKSVATKNGISNAPKSMPKAALSPVRKIDPRVYTDVQSNGLTSRIVKYHENSSKLNRSMSVGNLYNKPGQFPVVHLKRTEVHLKPKRNPSISVVRIAPPDKTVYQASTRSSILRGGSIIQASGLQKPNGKELRDNIPILPPAVNDVNPTRSVLDALKEISRKRINSDDVDCNDSVKKYCKESDEPRRKLHLPLPHLSTQSQQVSVITKRQREIPSPAESQTNSPESADAATKKRLCTKNNDISSSLSSSLLINTPKRKLQDVHGRPPIGRFSPSSISLAPPKAKQHCNDRNYVVSGTSERGSSFEYPPDQLTPIPPTPACEPVSDKPHIETEKAKPAIQESSKPKLTLFDKDYDTTQLVRKESNEEPLLEEEGIAGISFIEPKKNSPVFTGKNALIERVQTSKLSLMLSCLSGELNESDDEVDSKSKDIPRDGTALNDKEKEVSVSLVSSAASFVAPTNEAPKIAVSVATSSAPAMSSVAATTPSTISTPSFSFGLKAAEKPISATTTTSSLSSISLAQPVKPAFSFGNTISTSTASETVTSTKTVSTATVVSSAASSTMLSATAAPETASIITTSASVAPVGGFSFGQPKQPSDEKTTIASAASIPTPVESKLPNTPLFGFGMANPLGTSPNLAVSTTTVAFSASAPPSYSSIPTTSFSNAASTFGTLASSQSQTKPVFSFGTANTNSNAPVTAASSAASTFSLGSTAPKPLTIFGSSTENTTSGSVPPNNNQQTTAAFGSSNQPQTTSAFGGVGSAFTSATSAANSAPKFGESVNAFGATATAPSNPGGFSFGNPPGNTMGQGVFGTGTNAVINTAAANPAPFAFGAATNKTISSPPAFNFAASTASNNNAMPAFGAVAATNTATPATQTPFGFGQSTGSSSQAASTQSSQFNFQGAAQGNQTSTTGFNFGGSAVSNAPSFGVGSAPNNPLQTQTTKPFSFGGSNPSSAFTSISGAKSAAGGFAFNASSTNNAENKSMFASNGPQSTTQFSFSASSANKPPDQAQPTPAFGSLAASTNNTFGAPAMTPGKLFSFTTTPAGNTTSAAANQPTGLFGSPAANNTSTSLFPAASNVAPTQFAGKSNSSNATVSVFNFGNSTASATNNGSAAGGAAFAFRAGAPQQQNTNKPFSFATPAAGNMFGSKPLAFHFSSNAASGAVDSGNNNNNPLVPAGNPFVPTGASSGPEFSSMQRRDTRIATRRLKPK